MVRSSSILHGEPVEPLACTVWLWVKTGTPWLTTEMNRLPGKSIVLCTICHTSLKTASDGGSGLEDEVMIGSHYHDIWGFHVDLGFSLFGCFF